LWSSRNREEWEASWAESADVDAAAWVEDAIGGGYRRVGAHCREEDEEDEDEEGGRRSRRRRRRRSRRRSRSYGDGRARAAETEHFMKIEEGEEDRRKQEQKHTFYK
jgi:hypothetical protein